MPASRKFYFLPFKEQHVDHRSLEKDFKPYVNIYKSGIMTFYSQTLKKLGIDIDNIKTIVIRLYLDEAKRAIGFRFVNIITPGKTTKEEGYKILTIHSYQPKNTKYLAKTLNVSIKSLLNTLGNWSSPMKCKVNEYDDTDEYIRLGKIFYIEIPRSKK